MGANLTGYYQGYSYGAAANGVSFGRYVNSQTNIFFVAQASQTWVGPTPVRPSAPVLYQ